MIETFENVNARMVRTMLEMDKMQKSNMKLKEERIMLLLEACMRMTLRMRFLL